MNLPKMLKDGEEVIIQSKTTSKSLYVQLGIGAIPLIVAVILFTYGNPTAIGNGVIFTIISLIIMISAFVFILKNVGTLIVVTNKRVIMEKGVATMVTSEIQLEDIGSVSLAQPIIGSMFGYKKVNITAKSGISVFTASYIKNADELKEAIEKAKE